MKITDLKGQFHRGLDKPGMGVELIEEAARKYLPEGDEDFFD